MTDIKGEMQVIYCCNDFWGSQCFKYVKMWTERPLGTTALVRYLWLLLCTVSVLCNLTDCLALSVSLSVSTHKTPRKSCSELHWISCLVFPSPIDFLWDLRTFCWSQVPGAVSEGMILAFSSSGGLQYRRGEGSSSVRYSVLVCYILAGYGVTR